jgi:hypothetical protein
MKARDAAPVISDRVKIEREIEFIAVPPVAARPRSDVLEMKVNIRCPYEHSKTEISAGDHMPVGQFAG